jgi:hypothetical protein
MGAWGHGAWSGFGGDGLIQLWLIIVSHASAGLLVGDPLGDFKLS